MAKKGKYLQIRLFEGPENSKIDEEWNRFYNTEHAPLVVKNSPRVIRAYRYVAIEKEGVAPKYITIYEMENPGAMSDKKIEKIIHTDWYQKMQPHFRRTGVGTYKQIYPED
ncbi:MAG: hypothetical protein V1850_06635 [Candidatus Bathyarchaeota archaeon]